MKELVQKCQNPRIVFEGELEGPAAIHIAGEKEVICSVPVEQGLIGATVCLVAVYYVFMFNYPPGLSNLFIFLQKCLLQISDGKKLPTTLISFLDGINAVGSQCSN